MSLKFIDRLLPLEDLFQERYGHGILVVKLFSLTTCSNPKRIKNLCFAKIDSISKDEAEVKDVDEHYNPLGF